MEAPTESTKGMEDHVIIYIGAGQSKMEGDRTFHYNII